MKKVRLIFLLPPLYTVKKRSEKRNALSQSIQINMQAGVGG